MFSVPRVAYPDRSPHGIADERADTPSTSTESV
jgi:hypothetical protein